MIKMIKIISEYSVSVWSSNLSLGNHDKFAFQNWQFLRRCTIKSLLSKSDFVLYTSCSFYVVRYNFPISSTMGRPGEQPHRGKVRSNVGQSNKGSCSVLLLCHLLLKKLMERCIEWRERDIQKSDVASDKEICSWMASCTNRAPKTQQMCQRTTSI